MLFPRAHFNQPNGIDCVFNLSKAHGREPGSFFPESLQWLVGNPKIKADKDQIKNSRQSCHTDQLPQENGQNEHL